MIYGGFAPRRMTTRCSIYINLQCIPSLQNPAMPVGCGPMLLAMAAGIHCPSSPNSSQRVQIGHGLAASSARTRMYDRCRISRSPKVSRAIRLRNSLWIISPCFPPDELTRILVLMNHRNMRGIQIPAQYPGGLLQVRNRDRMNDCRYVYLGGGRVISVQMPSSEVRRG